MYPFIYHYTITANKYNKKDTLYVILRKKHVRICHFWILLYKNSK